MSGYTSAVLVLGVGLIVQKFCVASITMSGREVPYPLWLMGFVTLGMLGWVIHRNGKADAGVMKVVKSVVNDAMGKRE